MTAIVKVVLILIISSFFIHTVAGVGLSPPQLRLADAPMGENMNVASIVITNSGTEPDYIVFQIGCLARTREHKLRVICNNCSRDVGIQRGDLVNGSCPFCTNSTTLIFYDFTPDEILDNITLSCSSHPLERKGARCYYTVDEVQSKENILIDIYVDIPDSKPYYNNHWEARIMATPVDDVDEISAFLIYGAEAKFLIDTQKWQEEDEKVGANHVFVFLGIGGAVCTVAVVAAVFFKTRKKDVALSFPENAEKSGGHKIIKSIKGRKLL